MAKSITDEGNLIPTDGNDKMSVWQVWNKVKWVKRFLVYTSSNITKGDGLNDARMMPEIKKLEHLLGSYAKSFHRRGNHNTIGSRARTNIRIFEYLFGHARMSDI